MFQLGDKIMTHPVHPLPLLRRTRLRVSTAELGHALQSRGHGDESLGQVGALVAWCWSLPCTQRCPPPAPAPTLDMTLPPCKLLSETLLSLCVGAAVVVQLCSSHLSVWLWSPPLRAFHAPSAYVAAVAGAVRRV